MRKIKEILRLRYDLGLRQDQIARSCNIGQSTVHRYLERFAAAEVSWPLPAECDEARLEKLLFATRRGRPAGRENRPAPDFVALHSQLQKHKHLTLQLLWEEYREANRTATATAASASFTTLGAERRMWSCGTTTARAKRCLSTRPAPRFRFTTGNRRDRYRLRSSSPCSAPATTPSPKPREARIWPAGLIATCAPSNSSSGVPEAVIPDNPRTGVNRACRYEPDLNRTYHEMAEHYGMAVMPARPYKPRDKAKVESAFSSRSAGLWRRCVTTSSPRWRDSTKPSRRCWIG